MKGFAVVFDCAGTLLEKYRVAKDIDRGMLLHQIVSLSFIGTRLDYVLAVFQLDVPKDLEGVPTDLSIADFLDIYHVDLVVVCSNVPVAETTVLHAVARDTKSRVKDLVDVVAKSAKVAARRTSPALRQSLILNKAIFRTFWPHAENSSSRPVL